MRIKLPFCACGCGNRIKTREYHKYYGVPKYICGHNPTTSYSMLGKHHTKETKRKMSKSQKGRKHTEKSKREISKTLIGHVVSKSTRSKISKALLGRGLSIEHKQKMSESAKMKIFSVEHRENLSKAMKKLFKNPKNHPSWKGGISFEIYPLKFKRTRESICKRDDYICQLCGKTEKQNHKKLCAHHIDYDKKNCKPKNLITLCHVCNVEVNSDRETWARIFRNMIRKIYEKKNSLINII